MSVEKRVIELVEEKIADRPDLFLVDVKLHGNGLLSVFIDGDQGVAISDCAEISRHVGFHLEEEDVVGHAYNLEVSSPGLDMPLKLLRQYQKNVNRSLLVKKTDGTKHEGKLESVTEDGLTILVSRKEKGRKAQLAEEYIPFADITESKVLVSFK